MRERERKRERAREIESEQEVKTISNHRKSISGESKMFFICIREISFSVYINIYDINNICTYASFSSGLERIVFHLQGE